MFKSKEYQQLLTQLITVIDRHLSAQILDGIGLQAKLMSIIDLKNIYTEINFIIVNLSQISSNFSSKFFINCSEILRFIRLFTEEEISKIDSVEYFQNKFHSIPLKKLKLLLKKYVVS